MFLGEPRDPTHELSGPDGRARVKGLAAADERTAMKGSFYGLVSSGMLVLSTGVALLSLPVGSVLADVQESGHVLAKQARQPRVLGKRAVMHVYYYAPRTLEITAVTSRFFRDVDACERAVGAVLSIVTPHATDGDLVDAQCVAIDPPAEIARPENKPPPVEVTEL